MASFEYIPPAGFHRSIYGCSKPSENFRLKSLLLLSGLGTIEKKSTGKQKRLDFDFISLPPQGVNFSKASTIGHVTAKFPDYTRKELDAFFQVAIYKNIAIHKNIYNELTNLFGHLGSSNHIASFLHIYRIIEQVALCLPIVSIIKKGSFDNTFSDYKGLLQGGAKSDLSVLRKYSEYHLDSSIGDSVANMSFFRTSNPAQNVRVIKRFFTGKDAVEIVAETADSIGIKYCNVDKLIVGFRNQFFHYLFHEKNLSISDIESPDEFLEVCNPIFINYLAFLFHEFLESEMLMWGR